jgi:hypothetical protein
MRNLCMVETDMAHDGFDRSITTTGVLGTAPVRPHHFRGTINEQPLASS